MPTKLCILTSVLTVNSRSEINISALSVIEEWCLATIDRSDIDVYSKAII